MEILRVNGGRRLSGTIRLTAAKNAVLPIMAAALMADSPVTLHDVPCMADIDSMGRILSSLGCAVQRHGCVLKIDPSAAGGTVLDGELPTQLRSSIFLLGPLLSRYRRAEAVYPGGCAIGKRPIDLHLNGLAALGARVTEAEGRVRIDGDGMKPACVQLDFPSVGATENLMMAAAQLPGESCIHNAAREPEIVDLANFLNAMGARIWGAGGDTIWIQGVQRLCGVEYRPIPDRIVCGTLLAAAAITRGEIAVQNARPEHMTAVMGVLRQAGAWLDICGDALLLRADERVRPVRFTTAPFPGFPTDMQAPMMAIACTAQGESYITETLFENRFQQVEPLRSMGAQIQLSQRTALVRGTRLHGARVEARDLRCGAALVLAALAAEGESEVRGVPLIDRGYERLEEQLAQLGADIWRCRVDE